MFSQKNMCSKIFQLGFIRVEDIFSGWMGSAVESSLCCTCNCVGNFGTLLMSQDALEVMLETQSVNVSIGFTDVTLASDDTC